MKKSPAFSKIKRLSSIAKLVQKAKKEGNKIVLCHGVFDIIHPGHIRYLEAARKFGDRLVVTTTADKFVQKGPGRPVFKQELRAEVISSIAVVDYVGIVNSPSAVESIRVIRPDYYVKGPDFKKRKSIDGTKSLFEEEKAEIEKAGGELVFTEDDITFSSSKILTDYYDIYPREMKLYLDKLKHKLSLEALIDQLEKLKKHKVLIIGDSIIDQYCYCLPLGKSYKEPHMVQQYISEESYLGGVLATANHLAALVGQITLVTLLGKKKSFRSLISKKLKPAITPVFFAQSIQPTIIKRRFIDINSKQKMFQISYLKEDFELPQKLEKEIMDYLEKVIEKYDLVVCNDFGHGLISPAISKLLVRKSKFLALNVQANSANYGYNVITKFSRADYVCIDKQEIRLAMQNKFTDVTVLMKKIYRKMDAKMMLVTQGPLGTLSVTGDSEVTEAPALSSKVVDRVGAGDALFAITAPCVAAGMDPDTVSFLGNVAGALKVAIIGNKKQIEYGDLIRMITRLLR
jgi:rfaE bifunctional protein kinase chain/domain/rfaE bifunctional protein nucleotidyltransferase chain/domain